MAVDGEFQIIVANHQGNNASNNGYLVPLLDEVEATLGGQPEQCLADAGYLKGEELKALEEKDIDGCVSLRREGKGGTKLEETWYPATARMARNLATRGAGDLLSAQASGLGCEWLDQSHSGLSSVQSVGPGGGTRRVGSGLFTLNLGRMSSLMRLT